MKNTSFKKSAALAAAFAAFCASVYSLASAASYRPAAGPVQMKVSDADQSRVSSGSGEEDTFRTRVIRLWQGRAAVFETGAETPEEILPADTSQLPEDVISRLKEGIFIYSQEQYINYLEDFS